MKALSLIVFLTASFLAASEKDRVLFTGGNTLSGEVIAISESSGVQLRSENAVTPLSLNSEQLEVVLLSRKEGQRTDFSEILILNNGDRIPGTLTTLSSHTIGFETNYSGDLEIERKHARSIDFGVRPQRLVFSGPGKTSEWENNENWENSGETIISSAAGTIARSNILPAQFILRFRLEWEGNPSMRLFFCDDLLKIRGDTDRYYFEFNSAGMQLKRENANDERRWATIASIRRRPPSFPESQVDVELRVDREQGLIYLYLDGKSEGHYRDHFESFPTGSGIMLQSLAAGNTKNIVSRIEIYDWDAVSQVRGDEGHEDQEQDALISSSGERFSGAAEVLTEREDGSNGIVFSSPHTDDSFTIPKGRISTLYFRKLPSKTTPSVTDSVALLANGGKLHLSMISLDEKELTGRHPLLGEVQLDRGIVERLTFQEPGKNSKGESP